MRGALRHVNLIKAGFRIGVLPDCQVAGIMAGGATHLGVASMVRDAATLSRIVAIRALNGRIMRPMATRAFPAFVSGRSGLLVDYIKTVGPDVTFAAQLSAGRDGLIGTSFLVPKGEGG